MPIRVVDAAGKSLQMISAVSQEGVLYFGVEILLPLFDTNGAQRYIPLTRRLTLRLRDVRFELVIERNRGSVDGKPFHLEHPPLLASRSTEVGSTILVPIEFITEVVAPALGFTVDFNPNARRLRIREPQGSISLTQPASEAGVTTLILDPGHGGQDRGVQLAEGESESDITLRLCQRALAIAETEGWPVYLTRDGDRFVSTTERAQEAARKRGGVFISIHCNAAFSPATAGIRIYLNNPGGHLVSVSDLSETPDSQQTWSLLEVSQTRFLEESRQLGALLHAQLQAHVGQPLAPVEELPSLPLAQVMMPAVLVEVGFLTNAADLSLVSDPVQVDALMQTILEAGQQFLAEPNRAAQQNRQP